MERDSDQFAASAGRNQKRRQRGAPAPQAAFSAGWRRGRIRAHAAGWWRTMAGFGCATCLRVSALVQVPHVLADGEAAIVANRVNTPVQNLIAPSPTPPGANSDRAPWRPARREILGRGCRVISSA